MKSLALFIWPAFALTQAVASSDPRSLFNIHALRDAVNDMPGTTWFASSYKRFENVSVAQVQQLLGAVLPGDHGYLAPTQRRRPAPSELSRPLPGRFDAREAFPECADITGHVRDQSNCGSCWAFAAVEAFNDRLCMVKGEHALLSPEDTVSCCSGRTCAFSRGCNGGQPSGAWNWFTTRGVSTGGDFSDLNSGQTCKPYSMGDNSGDVAYSTPDCVASCNDDMYKVPYENDKHFARSSYQIEGEEDIQREIMERGSISVSFMVYEDFMSYSSGVYQMTTGELLGGHAVKMIGWGEDNGTPYWLCVNSWSQSWGEMGLFRILRGSDECGIEEACVAGEA